MTLNLTETQRWDLINGMRIAAETYQREARYYRDIPADSNPAAARVVAQFEQQAKDALALADLIENADD